MNWRRGLLRVWVVASLIWLAGWLWYVWATCERGQDNKLYCYRSVFDDWMAPVPLTFLDYASIVATGMVVGSWTRALSGATALLSAAVGFLLAGLLAVACSARRRRMYSR